MTRIAVVVAFVALGAGCFTAIGSAVGAQKPKRIVSGPDNRPEEDGNYMLQGALVGAVMDAALVLALVGTLRDFQSGCWTPAECH